MPSVEQSPIQSNRAPQLARIVLTAFILTFIAARVLVILIMTRHVPDLYLHLGGTHVHHLNYGIFILSAVGAYLLFAPPIGRRLRIVAGVYGVGLALTFDEFGMWLHLGGRYWQRASFDAIVVVCALLSLIVAAPTLRHFRPRHWGISIVIAALSIVFAYLLYDSVSTWQHYISPKLQRIETEAPP